MSSYTTVPGDTFSTVSGKAYGTPEHAASVAAANPGVLEPLAPGTVLKTPPRPGAPTNALRPGAFETPDETAVLIGGKRFRFWTTVSVSRALDGLSSVTFSAPFDPQDPNFRETFRPFSFKPVSIYIGGELIFTGTLVDVDPETSAQERTVTVTCYGLPGVLRDCPPPASAYPVEFNDQNLKEIAASLCSPFGITVDFQADPGAAFEREAIPAEGRIFPFLATLAKQRNLVMADNPQGHLVFKQSVSSGDPVAVLEEGASPVFKVVPSFDPQNYYSDITGLEDVYLGTDGSQFTFRNPHLKGVLRPLVFQAPDVLGGEIADAVNAKAGRMFANMASYLISVATWRDPQGELWAPDTIISLVAPGAMIYSAYHFLVRGVTHSTDSKKRTAEIELSFIGAFSGQAPDTLPWD
jgi:prophage tail gpP-like protein